MNTKYPLSYILVDDDEDDRFLIKLALQQADRPLPIYEFTNGQELLDYLDYNSSIREDHDYHWLIVMDVNMPILDGMSTLKHIRQNDHWQKIPILILSTSSSDHLANDALRSGANGYITKPTSIESYKDIFDEFFVPWLSPQADK